MLAQRRLNYREEGVSHDDNRNALPQNRHCESGDHIGEVLAVKDVEIPILRSPLYLISREGYRFVVVKNMVAVGGTDERFYLIYVRGKEDAEKLLALGPTKFRNHGQEERYLVLYASGGGGYVFQLILNAIGKLAPEDIVSTW